MNHAYRHIIWDWNGTLLNDVTMCVDVLNGILSRRQVPQVTFEQYRARFGFPVRDYYVELGVDFSNETFESMSDEFIDHYTAQLDGCDLQPGVRDGLTALREAGVTHSVLSAYHQRLLEEAVERFGLDGDFIRLIGLDDYTAHSKLDNGRRWLQQMHYGPHEVLLVGDTVHDHEVADALGVNCVLLTCGHQSRQRLTACGVPVLNTPQDITKVVLT